MRRSSVSPSSSMPANRCSRSVRVFSSPGRLRAAQHEHVENRDLRVVEPERAVERVAVLHRAPIGPARERGPLALHEPVDTAADRVLVVIHDRVAVGGLVAGEPQRVQRERIDVGRGPLLLDQAAEHADLDSIRFHLRRRGYTTRGGKSAVTAMLGPWAYTHESFAPQASRRSWPQPSWGASRSASAGSRFCSTCRR